MSIVTASAKNGQLKQVHITWTLNVFIEDLSIARELHVSGDLHVGTLIYKLVESINIGNKNWSDYGLWWPNKKIWLLNTKSTLDQYGVQAEDNLLFQRVHKQLRFEMPNLEVVDVCVDFSISLLNVILHVCKELGVRHGEEMSIARVDACKSNDESKSASNQPNKTKRASNDANTLNVR
jgi:kindlin 2